MRESSDTVDLLESARNLRRGWREIAALTIAGAAVAVAVLAFAPRRFSAGSSIVIKSEDMSGSLLSRLGVDQQAAGSLLPGGGKTTMETELQILSSRAVVGRAVDSLLLQVRVLSPAGVPANAILSAVNLPGAFKHFHVELVPAPGLRVSVPGGTITFASRFPLPASRGLPASRVQLDLLDREDAIDYVEKHLVAEKAAGEVARVRYRAADSLTAAAVPNAIVDIYLARRHTTDRGVNQHRVEFLSAQSDSISRQLAAADAALRREQEATGILDATATGKVALERMSQLRMALTNVQVESGALDQLIAMVRGGKLSVRQLAAYPTFIKSSAISEMLAQLTTLETDRQKLLDRRTEADPEVKALESSIKSTEGQLLPIATAYAQSLDHQRADLNKALDTTQVAMAKLPGTAEADNQLQRNVLRLGQIYAGVQAQLVGARLAAIGEGGDVRQLDPAVPPRKPSFPDPTITLSAGIGGGLALGIVVALLMGSMGRWMRDPSQIERATGIPALRFDPATPLLMTNGARTVLLVPSEPRSRTGPVARRLAETALARASNPTVLDLSASQAAISGVDVNTSIERLEREHAMVIVQLPELRNDTTVAALREQRPVLLVAPAKRIDRGRLVTAVQTLERAGVPCAGIVLSGGERDALSAG